MAMKPRAETCRVCGGTLPLPEPDQVLRGGRPRVFCGPRCRYRASRRGRTVRKLEWWSGLAQCRGDETPAERFRRMAEAVAGAAWRRDGPR